LDLVESVNNIVDGRSFRRVVLNHVADQVFEELEAMDAR
jgi:hypothetical protein